MQSTPTNPGSNFSNTVPFYPKSSELSGCDAKTNVSHLTNYSSNQIAGDPAEVLQIELIKFIFSFLPVKGIVSSSFVSKKWKEITDGNEIWRNAAIRLESSDESKNGVIKKFKRIKEYILDAIKIKNEPTNKGGYLKFDDFFKASMEESSKKWVVEQAFNSTVLLVNEGYHKWGDLEKLANFLEERFDTRYCYNKLAETMALHNKIADSLEIIKTKIETKSNRAAVLYKIVCSILRKFPETGKQRAIFFLEEARKDNILWKAILFQKAKNSNTG